MNTFSANFSSSPGSEQLPNDTPPRRNFFYQPSEPSTTPAVPPPSQIFGSSQLGTGVSKLQFARGSNEASAAPRPVFSSGRIRDGASDRPKSRLFHYSTNTNDSEADEEYTEDDMEEDWADEDGQTEARVGPGFASINKPMTAPSLLKFSTTSLGKSLTKPKRVSHSVSKLPRKGKEDMISGLARNLTKGAQPASLKESDRVILGTEQILRQLDEACAGASSDVEQHIMISGAAQELVPTWQQGKPDPIPDQGQIGPLPHESLFDKARFVATLLLELYHPQGVEETRSLVLSDSQMAVDKLPTKPIPLVLLDWMKAHHSNFDSLLASVMNDQKNPANSEFFWDSVHTFFLRGQFSDLMHLFAEADFSYATDKMDDGTSRPRYTGTQLQAIQSAIYSVRQVLNACPALQQDDWNVSGQEWDLYRKEIEMAIEDLTDMADGYVHDSKDPHDLLGRSGPRPQLPHDIYGYLRTAYSILLGDAETILALSQDWLEATMLLAVWWDGVQDTSVAQWSFDVSRAKYPEVSQPPNAYLSRVRESFLCVTDPSFDSNFHINTLSPVEIGVGAVLQGDIQSVLRILQILSLPVASTVADIGLWAGWLSHTTSTVGLDSEDLMVLNYGSEIETIKKDDIVVAYADALFDRAELTNSEGQSFAGWEVAFSVIVRLDDQKRMQDCITGFVDNLPVTTREQAEKLMRVCLQLGLKDQAQKVSAAFADFLVNTSSDYGTALLCYARAHAEDKIRQVIDLLNSYCLVQSKAYPSDEELDETLRIFVSNPRAALSEISENDPSVAETLQFYLAGYACLRKYYNYRDQASLASQHGQSTPLKATTRKKAAAKALTAAINSAADSIYGGLYDQERRSAIQVDGLLPLLGEATALLAGKGEKRVLTSDQMYSVLAAIEDLETVSDRVFHATEECMEASLRNYHGSAPPSPHAMLKKSISSGTNSNFSFSIMGSEMLARSDESLAAKSMGSAVLVGPSGTTDNTARGWDWRAQFVDTNVTATGILKHLRVSIAKELSIASLEEDGAGNF